MKIKIAVIGNFGFKNNQVDGQTFRTRLVIEQLNEHLGTENVNWIDTSYIKTKPLSTIIGMIKVFNNSKNVIIMPGIRGLKLFLPFYLLLKKIYNTRVHYLVVGGWLSRLVFKKTKYISMLKNLDGLYVQTNRLKNELNGVGINNVTILPNFRSFSQTEKEIKTVSKPLRVVFFSRIIKEKGIELAVKAIKMVNDRSRNIQVVLDIWGPIGESYTQEFKHVLDNSNNIYINYKGFLDPNDIYIVLSKYDVMLFPTYYQGEGFPGAILDAYISGLPVIASNWQDNVEIVKHKETGMLFESKQIIEIVNSLEYLIDNPDLILSMSENCRYLANEYHVRKVIPQLLIDMNIN